MNAGNCNGALPLLPFRFAAAALPVTAPCRVSVPLVVVDVDVDELADELELVDELPDVLQAATARPAMGRPASAAIVAMVFLMMSPRLFSLYSREEAVWITPLG